MNAKNRSKMITINKEVFKLTDSDYYPCEEKFYKDQRLKNIIILN
jgi:hypothetical protein